MFRLGQEVECKPFGCKGWLRGFVESIAGDGNLIVNLGGGRFADVPPRLVRGAR